MIKKIFREAWNVYVPNLGILVIATLLMEVGYLILLKLTAIGGEFLRAFFLAGMYNVIFQNKKCEFEDIFIAFKDGYIAKNVFLYCLILIIGTSIGILLLVIPGVYFFFATLFAVPLIVKNKMEVIDAVKGSIKLFNKNFFLILLFLFIILLLNSIAIFPYGMLSIFTVPFSVCLLGKLFESVYSSDDAVFRNVEIIDGNEK